MTGLKSTLFAVSVLGVISSLVDAKNPRLPSWRTYMRDAEDPKLSMSIRDFFEAAQADGEDDDGTMETRNGDIKRLENQRVKLLEDTLISDYIGVNTYMWDYDTEEADAADDNPDTPPNNDDPLIDENTTIEYDDSEKLYFVLAESRSDPATDPLIIWLQGGPGCSSMLGLFTENGPYNFSFDPEHIKDPYIFEKNEWSWNNKANVMYVDQPLGTGMSFANRLGAFRMSEDALA